MTTIAKDMRPETGCRASTTIEADLGVADQLVEMRGPGAVRHEQFHTIDAIAAQRFFASAYTPGWHITGFARGSAVTHQRCEVDLITLDDVLFEGRVGCEIRTADSVVVIQPRAGSLTLAGEPTTRVDTPVIATDDMPCLLQANSARFAVVSFQTKFLRQVAADRDAPLPPHIQFVSARPRSREVVRVWGRAFDYVVNIFASADAAERPLIVAAAAQLLAAALLECFPSNMTGEQDLLSNPSLPAALKGAVSFIQRHAGHGIGVNDVAAAVRLTPRAVQYLFRQQLDTTPTEYLRRVRLHRAHMDLLGSDRPLTTVTEIAQRWGFAHTGRFAVIYRQTYGQSPHTTLQQ